MNQYEETQTSVKTTSKQKPTVGTSVQGLPAKTRNKMRFTKNSIPVNGISSLSVAPTLTQKSGTGFVEGMNSATNFVNSANGLISQFGDSAEQVLQSPTINTEVGVNKGSIMLLAAAAIAVIYLFFGIKGSK